jgi:hypothetical protein
MTLPNRHRPIACSILLLALTEASASPARADFFDSARRTVQTDIPRFFQRDVPHFFQDDIPCAFGHPPTSGARAECKSSRGPVRDTRVRSDDGAGVPPPPPLDEPPAAPGGPGERQP